MLKKTVAALISGLIFSFSAGCGHQSSINDPLADSGIYQTAGKKALGRGPAITVATYNIKTLFKALKTNKAKADKVAVALGKAIHEINADVIAFEEVESIPAFKSFSEKYLKDMNYNFYSRENTSGKLNNVAVLSRFKVTSVNRSKNIKSLNNEPVQEVPLPTEHMFELNFKGTNNYDFTLFVTYLKPLSAGYKSEQRDIDIESIKRFVIAYQKKDFLHNFVIAGNLNEVPSAPELATILDPRSSGLNTHDVVSEDLGNGPETNTVFDPQNPKRVDYLLVSAGVFNEYVTGSVKIYKPEQQSQTLKNDFFYQASDHLPISAKLDVSTDTL